MEWRSGVDADAWHNSEPKAVVAIRRRSAGTGRYASNGSSSDRGPGGYAPGAPLNRPLGLQPRDVSRGRPGDDGQSTRKTQQPTASRRDQLAPAQIPHCTLHIPRCTWLARHLRVDNRQMLALKATTSAQSSALPLLCSIIPSPIFHHPSPHPSSLSLHATPHPRIAQRHSPRQSQSDTPARRLSEFESL